MLGDIRDRSTEAFYKHDRVADEYEEIRFQSRAGRLIDRLQKEAVSSFVNPGELVGKRVLDMGCGTGRFSRVFSSLGARVVGFDVSRKMLLHAKKQRSAEIYIEGNALILPFRESYFALSISVNVLNHLFSYEQAIHEICRVSKKVVLGLPNRHSLSLLAYIYRILRGWGTEYTGFTVKKYETDTLPYSRYFSFGELKRLFQENGFGNVQMQGCWIFPILPEWAVSTVARINRISPPLLKRFGTFFAIGAEKE
jgi:ubiquinone/menaquinone biosynthesis C-methylase UbiE